MIDDSSRLAYLVLKIETSPYTRICAKIGSLIAFIIIAFTGYQIWVDLDDRQVQRRIFNEEREERQKSEKLRAWSYLLDASYPSQVRGEGLNILVRQGENLDGIKIECPARSAAGERCEEPARLTGLDVNDASIGWVYFNRVNVARSVIRGSSMNIIGYANFFDNSLIQSSAIQFSGWSNAFFYSNIIDSQIFLDDSQILTISSSNISGSCVNTSPDVTDQFYSKNRAITVGTKEDLLDENLQVDILIDSVWAYADNPPRLCDSGSGQTVDILKHVKLCNPNSAVTHDPLLERLYSIWNPAREFDRKDIHLVTVEAAVYDRLAQDQPEGQVLIGTFRGCRPMSLLEAATSYPDLYSPVVVEE